jgi:hypothetical protein
MSERLRRKKRDELEKWIMRVLDKNETADLLELKRQISDLALTGYEVGETFWSALFTLLKSRGVRAQRSVL